MDLHGIASGVISAINPMISVTLARSTGYTTADDGTRTPTYTTSAINVQLQGMSESELKQINALNIGGILRKIYTNGVVSSLDRATGNGGDLITLADNTVWLVVHILEQWPDWVSAVIQKQEG